MHFGEELRQERERRGITLDDIAVSTRVSLRHLHALEDERFSDLPGGVFNRGIVRSYAQCCGLDADGTLQNFLEAVHATGLNTVEREDDWVELAEAVHRTRKEDIQLKRSSQWLGVLAMLLAVAALAACVFLFLVHRGVIADPMRGHLLHSAGYIFGISRHFRSRVQ